MKVRKAIKIILGVVVGIPILLIALFIIILILPTSPLPIEEVFLGACSEQYKKEYIIIDRPHSFSAFPQGVWYHEDGVVSVSTEKAKEIFNSLSNNKSYEYKNKSFEKFIVGDVLANCKINLKSGVIKYTYVLW